ncbi:MAG: nucleotidyl transferase AbiEii/AbiGii toxin family protein [Flavobacteriales bacterium]|nr:nucleotidyl transferase AbiEii/AbiGii toxin family protein [Flavobacteriales bacterium]
MLHYNTVTDLLKSTLFKLMESEELKDFRLVGGTALSLQLGHRISIDIDLFTDCDYGSVDFEAIENYLELNFSYIDYLKNFPIGMGKSYIIGKNRDNSLKLDVFYSDRFIQPIYEVESIKMATISEILAMKLDVIQRIGRKKDFWDVHELIPLFNIEKMLSLHKQRYPYNHDRKLILENLTNFSLADEEYNPICLKGKYWEFIKEDFEEFKNTIS